jgi:dimethylglycine dehydrogenase
MEKGYRGWGAELTNEVTMLDADMERFIRFDKPDFVGRQATLDQQEKGLLMKLVYFQVDSTDSDVRGGEPVFDGDTCIGVTTSGAWGHCVGKGLGFAYVNPPNADPGCSFHIELLGESFQATVLSEPAYDPGNERLRA